MAKVKDIIPIDEIKKKLNPVFKDKGIKLVILFGSVVSGRTHAYSDIDIAFLYEKPVDILKLTNRVIRLLHNDNVDVVDLRRANPLLRFSIVRSGTLIYEREQGMFNEFYSLTFRRYVDTKKLRDAQTTVIGSFLKERHLT
jgi:predicted nucleotidyltransferase